MGLIIDSEQADRLARKLAEATGESIATAVTVALAERLRRVKRPDLAGRRKAIEEFRQYISQLPVQDQRTDDEILGHDDSGAIN
ncbi:MAG TPA: type II toxin-antitoxin system VapB family antitoxin [Azospirillum sp.]|nr:type II toxin-antitoxin system VapB family antitoxin [Azospirillum sp.]